MADIPRPLLGSPWDKRVTAEWLQANLNAPVRPFNSDTDYDLIDELNKKFRDLYVSIVDAGLIRTDLGFVNATTTFFKDFPTDPGTLFRIVNKPAQTVKYSIMIGPNVLQDKLSNPSYPLAPNARDGNYQSEEGKLSADTSALRQLPHYVNLSVHVESIRLSALNVYFSYNTFTHIDDNPDTYGQEFGVQIADCKITIQDTTGNVVYEGVLTNLRSDNRGFIFRRHEIDDFTLPRGSYKVIYEMLNMSPWPAPDDTDPNFSSIIPSTYDEKFLGLTVSNGETVDRTYIKTGIMSIDRRIRMLADDSLTGQIDLSTNYEFYYDVNYAAGSSRVENDTLIAAGDTRIRLDHASAPRPAPNTPYKHTLYVEFILPDLQEQVLPQAFSILALPNASDADTFEASMTQFSIPRIVKYPEENFWRVLPTHWDLPVLRNIKLQSNVKYRIELVCHFVERTNDIRVSPGPDEYGFYTSLQGLFEADTGQYIVGGPGVLWNVGYAPLVKNSTALFAMTDTKYVYLTPSKALSSTWKGIEDATMLRLNGLHSMILPADVLITRWTESKGL